MVCIHCVSSTGKYNETFMIENKHVVSIIGTMFFALRMFGGGSIDEYSVDGTLINRLEV